MEAYIGTIILFAGSYAPRDWAFCDGSLLNISGHEAVFAILGNTYGGDGVKNFALPNLPDVGDTDGKHLLHYIICLQGIFPTRD